MHIAQTVKANVPPSNSVPGGDNNISLIYDNDFRGASVLFCKWESCETTESLPHGVRRKRYKPKLRCKAITKQNKIKLNIEKLQTVAWHIKKCWITVFCESWVFVDTKVFMYN